MSSFSHENVGRLNIAVNNASTVGSIEGISDLDSQRQNCFDLQRLPPDAVLQVKPVQILHDDEQPTFVFADFVDRADVRMVEGRCGTRLSPELFKCLRIMRNIVGQKLQSDEAPKLGISALYTSPSPKSKAVHSDPAAHTWLRSIIGEAGKRISIA